MECHYDTSLASNFHGIGIQWLQGRVSINADSFLCRFPIHWIVKIHALDVSLCVFSVNETTNLQQNKHESIRTGREHGERSFCKTCQGGFQYLFLKASILTMTTKTARPTTTAIAMTATVPTGLSVCFLTTVSLLTLPVTTL